MNKKRLIILFSLFALMICFIGCEGTLTIYVYESDVSGRAVNAQSSASSTEWWTSGSDSLEGAAVKFFQLASDGSYSSTAKYNSTLSSSGTFSVNSVIPGRYKIVGEKDGWTFVPRYVDIAGKDMSLPDLIAYRSVSDKVLIFVSWEDEDIDVDGVLTYDPDPDNGTNEERNKIDTSNTTFEDYIKLERSVSSSASESIPRIETISISSTFPRESHADFWDDYDALSLASLPENQMRYYVTTDAESLTGLDTATPAASAYAQVDVMFNGEHLGVWELPYNTCEKTLHVVTIDATGEESESGHGFKIYSAGNANYGIRGSNANTNFVPVDFIR